MKRVAVAALLLSLAVPSAAQAQEQLNFRLDEVITAKTNLEYHDWYVLTVAGTGSFHKPSVWANPMRLFKSPAGRSAVVCGTPEPAPLFGSDNGPVGFDAETIFARPVATEVCASEPVPRPTRRFEIWDGVAWYHPTPLDGRHVTPSPGHSYSYPMYGQDRKPGFRILDTPRSDNYGNFLMKLRLANRGDCVNGQWKAFVVGWKETRVFANQAQCEASLPPVVSAT